MTYSTDEPSKQDPDLDLDSHVRRLTSSAIQLQRQKKDAEAISLYRKILEISPSSLTAISNLAILLDLSGDKVGALDLFRKAAQLYPNNPDVWVNLSRYYYRIKDFVVAVACCQSALAISGNHASALSMLREINTQGISIHKSIARHQALNVVYDVGQAPITFDAVTYFATAAAYAELNGYNYINIIINATKFRRISRRELNYDEDTKHWRLLNIVFRLATLIPSARNIFIVRDHYDFSNGHCYPPNYDPLKPIRFPYLYPDSVSIYKLGGNVQIFQPSERALKWAQQQFATLDKSVVLIVRSADFERDRDAKIKDWAVLNEHLKAKGYSVVTIPDQNVALGKFESYIELGFDLAIPAAIDIDLRLALCSVARMNFAWAGGQSLLLWYTKCNFRIFGLLNRNSTITTKEYFEKVGPMIGTQPEFFHNNQKILWLDANDITAEYLISESEKALQHQSN